MVELVRAQDVFNEAKALLEGQTVTGELCPQDVDKAERLLNELLCHNVGNSSVLYVLGSLYLTKGYYGLAIQLLSQVTQVDQRFAEAWNNLGLAFRGVNDWDRATLSCRQAAKLMDRADIWCNLSGLFVNRHMPEKVLEFAERSLSKDPSYNKALWHKAMALLEMRRWGEAWEPHESRLTGGANHNIAERNYHGPDGMTPWWDGQAKGKVAIHGEQGMGDEIMFSSCIPDAIATGAEIILEPSPRLETLFARSFPEAKVFGTDHVDGRRWVGEIGPPDFKCGVGSLPKFYRPVESAFPGKPYLIVDRGKAAWWSDKLKALGPKPRIGLAWQGGVQSTRNDARSFHPILYAPLFRHDVSWISLQYDETASLNVQEVKDATGVKIVHWPKAVEAIDPETGKPNDLDELAALMSRLDLVISVCQTAIHFAGALGIPCWCLTPSQPSWRYSAVESEAMPWYSSVRLIRQAEGTSDWLPVIERVDGMLGEFLAERATG